MNPCPLHGWACPSLACDARLAATGRLTSAEQSELRDRLTRGQHVDLASLAIEDRLALTPFVPKGGTRCPQPTPVAPVAPVEGAPGSSDPLAGIVDRLTALPRAGFADARAFLRHADSNVLANLLGPEDFQIVMTLREADAAPIARWRAEQFAAMPPSREQITADIRARAARGEDVNAIATSTGESRFRVRAVLDQNTPTPPQS